MKVHKFEMPPFPKFELSLPPDAKIIHVGLQRGTPRLWVAGDMSDFDIQRVQRTFVVLATGQEFECDKLDHCGTFMTEDGLVFHVFER